MSDLGVTPSGARPWDDLAGVWGIATNKLELETAGSGADEYDNMTVVEARVLNPDSPQLDGDVDVQITLSTVKYGCGLVWRVVDKLNCWKFFADTALGKYFVVRRQAGVNVAGSWRTVAVIPADGDKVRVVAKGATFEFYVNGVLRQFQEGGGSINDATFRTAQRVGVLAGPDTAARWDDFSCGLEPALSTAPPPVGTVPAAPTNLTATAGDGQVTLTWVAPSVVGSSPLTGYSLLRYSSGGTLLATTALGLTTSTTVTGLTNGTSYYWTVQARNAVGLSAASGVSPTVTPQGTLTYRARWFNNTTLTGTAVLDEQLATFPSFDTASTPRAGVLSDGFSLEVTWGQVIPAGDRRDTVTADDGVRVYRDAVLEIDQWQQQASTTFTDDWTQAVEATVAFKVEYFEQAGSAVLSFASAPLPAVDPGARDLFLQPFHTYSPWNYPNTDGIQGTDWDYPSIGVNCNADRWTHSAWEGTGSDDTYAVTIENNHTGISPHPISIKVPSGITPQSGNDKHVTLFTPDNETLYSLYGWGADAVGQTQGGIDINDVANTISADLGYQHNARGYAIGWCEDGPRAADGPAVAGLIRLHELTAAAAATTEVELAAAIPHAIAVMLTFNYLKSGWVWPAGSEDSFANIPNHPLRYTGNIPQGTFLYLPSSFNPATAGITSRVGKAVAYAFRNFGAFVTDQSGGGLTVQLEQFPHNDATGLTYRDQVIQSMTQFRGSLRRATNNGPNGSPICAPDQRQKGGGNPIAPLAPAV